MQIVRAGGAELEVEQSGSGPDLLLFHSLLTDPGSFAAMVPALSRRRRVTLVSLPGFGRSSAAGPSIEDSADRLAHLVSTLGEKPDVLGNGYGGVIAVALAARHGGKLGKLVLVDAGAAFPETGRAPFRAMAEAVEKGGMATVVDTAVRRLFPESYLAAHPSAIVERRDVVAGIRGAKLIELPGCGHCPPLQQPAELVAVITPFVGIQA
jgi:pimeloyl-ACP methyl ester carboxylesterase